MKHEASKFYGMPKKALAGTVCACVLAAALACCGCAAAGQSGANTTTTQASSSPTADKHFSVKAFFGANSFSIDGSQVILQLEDPEPATYEWVPTTSASITPLENSAVESDESKAALAFSVKPSTNDEIDIDYVSKDKPENVMYSVHLAIKSDALGNVTAVEAKDSKGCSASYGK